MVSLNGRLKALEDAVVGDALLCPRCHERGILAADSHADLQWQPPNPPTAMDQLERAAEAAVGMAVRLGLPVSVGDIELLTARRPVKDWGMAAVQAEHGDALHPSLVKRIAAADELAESEREDPERIEAARRLYDRLTRKGHHDD
jgi:hypothetical protein